MQKKIIIIIVLVLCSINLKAQQISPTDLFQYFKYWRMNDPHYDKNTYDYIQTVDKDWQLRIPPMKSDTSFTILFEYYKDKQWVNGDECKLMFDYNKINTHKSLMYEFTDRSLWENYNQQMRLMNAISLATFKINGGNEMVWSVNDITIHITDFPPGINGIDATYEVMITN